MSESAFAARFLAQNTLAAADLTDEDMDYVDTFAEHHSGGLIVLGGYVDDNTYVKMHDSWGDDGKVVVHSYLIDGGDDDQTVLSFDSGHEALRAFLRLVAPGELDEVPPPSPGPDRRLARVEGVFVLRDGERVHFMVGTDKGWSQWGAAPSVLGDTVDYAEAVAEALGEFLPSDNDEDDDRS